MGDDDHLPLAGEIDTTSKEIDPTRPPQNRLDKKKKKKKKKKSPTKNKKKKHVWRIPLVPKNYFPLGDVGLLLPVIILSLSLRLLRRRRRRLLCLFTLGSCTILFRW